jgi:hypothetical protein
LRNNPIISTCGRIEKELQPLRAFFDRCIPFAKDNSGDFNDLLAQLDRIAREPHENPVAPEVRLAA